MRIPRAIRQANAPKAQKPVVELNIDPTEAWVRWASELHLSPDFDKYAYNVPFLTHLVNLIGEEPEYVEEEPPAIEVQGEPVERLLFQGSGNWEGVEARHVACWLRVVNSTRQAGADIMGWHRSTLVKILSRERRVTEGQAVRFLAVLARLDEWQRLQYFAMVKGTQ